jgi:hypothetical protein
VGIATGVAFGLQAARIRASKVIQTNVNLLFILRTL